MSKRIEFRPDAPEVESLGRNGPMTTSGVYVDDLGYMLITPITGRGNAGRGYVGIDPQSVPEVIGALTELYLRRFPDGYAMIEDQVQAGVELAKPRPPVVDAIALDQLEEPPSLRC